MTRSASWARSLKADAAGRHSFALLCDAQSSEMFSIGVAKMLPAPAKRETERQRERERQRQRDRETERQRDREKRSRGSCPGSVVILSCSSKRPREPTSLTCGTDRAVAVEHFAGGVRRCYVDRESRAQRHVQHQREDHCQRDCHHPAVHRHGIETHRSMRAAHTRLQERRAGSLLG